MKYDVDKYLEGRELNREELHKDLQAMLRVYDKIMELHRKREKTGEHLSQANKVGKDLIAEIKRKHPEAKKTANTTAKKDEAIKSKSKTTKEKTPKVIDELAECRRLIKVERQKKIKKGEIKAPVKQSRYTKIKNALVKVLKSIPGLKSAEITTTQNALTESAKKIFDAHGWKQWKLIDDILKKEADKRIAKIQKAKE